jgi:hypothetical protein
MVGQFGGGLDDHFIQDVLLNRHGLSQDFVCFIQVFGRQYALLRKLWLFDDVRRVG